MQIPLLLINVLVYLIYEAHGIQLTTAIWADKDFTGNNVVITYYNNGECINFGKDWQNSISSANTHTNCIEIYNELDCKGKMTYLVPGSPAHNNFVVIGINDATKSFRSCNLDEEPVCIACSKSEKRLRKEYNFWYYFFATQGDSLQRQYEKQVDDDGTFNRWNFVLGNSVSTNKGDQYMDVLEWAKNVMNANVYPPDNRFCKSFVKTLTNLAEDVEKERAHNLSALKKDWNDRKYVVNAYILQLWERVVKGLRYAITQKIHKEC